MLQIQVRTVTDNGSVSASSRVLETHNITYTSPFSASATLEFSVSRADFVPTQFPFLVRVEYAANGGKFNKVPHEDLFIVEQDADDSKDLGQIVTYQAQAFVPWLLAGAYVGTGQFEKDGERTIDFDGQGRASSGHIMKYFIDESKSRGWLPVLDYTFAVNTDSSGTNWNMGARAGISWRLETFYTQVLEQLTTQGFCDWNTSGNKLNMYNPGTLGTDYSESVVLGGQDFARVPVKTDMTGWYTHVIAVSDAGRVHVQNTAAESRFGRRSIAMTQSGVKDVPTSTKLANELLAEGLKLKREESYRWTPEAGQVKPWVDFNNGDMVTAMSRGGAKPLRVIGITVIQDNKNYAEVEVSVGEKISTLAAKNRKKLDSVSVGGVAGGSGDAFPSNPGPSPLKPTKPLGLQVTHNEGGWAQDHVTAIANVGLTWDAVTADVDGGEITVTDYEVWSRLPSSTKSFDTSTNTNSVDILNWRPGEERLVSVRAKSQAGTWSGWSNELSVTPDSPGTLVPKAPTNVVIVSNEPMFTPDGAVSRIVLGWDAVTQATDNEPITIADYEVLVDGFPHIRSESTGIVLNWGAFESAEVRVRARSNQGIWGNLSEPIDVSSNVPDPVESIPTTPTIHTGYGNVIVRWDGEYVTGQYAGHYSVFVEARLIGGEEWLQQGAPLTSDGTAVFQLGGVGSQVEARLASYDRLGRRTGTSAVVSITVDAIDGADLLANSVGANQIRAGSITTNHVQADFGASLILEGNDTIQFLVQKTNDTDTSISETQAVFVVTEDGAEIKLVNASSVIKFTPNGITMTGGTSDPTSWTKDKLTVNEIDASKKARIVNHVFEAAGAGRTIVRPV